MKRRTANWAGTDGHAGREVTADGMTPGEDGAGRSGPRFERRLGRRDLTAVGEVRAQLRELLAHWGEPGRAYTAELLTSELVTNALVHTDGGAVVKATLMGGPGAPAKGLLRVEVRDFFPRRPEPRGPLMDTGARGLDGVGHAGCGGGDSCCAGAGPGGGAGGGEGAEGAIEKAATSGRGLLLVHSLADGWGVRPHGVGKAVWFELGAQEP
ncbi:ATP-binding protein [Streptomyces albireticuli]|uniref:ATP-binding protein n=2 Tax=Streptomyces albireticuli TaxID=1940 RepID=UPI001E6466DA|nr:ATP-binding protein [Streptomyces albireticuli]MCD9140667.1 ATP-binding protein [Streptomyces albireticuli]MCD9161371.1 ATP-binding protein [Streptomyces albireticuli]MCD9190571.1 ATP-binding protein [Streptomyces albireticuli]